MSQFRILLVGAGQLGSRHLQALASLEFPVSVDVVDPDEKSLSLSRSRVLEVVGSHRHEFSFFSSMPLSCERYELTIVATSAAVRRGVIEFILERFEVRWIILEKVLFQRAEDCRAVGELLLAGKVQAWVNAPRRMWPDYVALQRSFKNEKILSISCDGGGWGLACNAYHFLDLISWMCDGERMHLNGAFLDSAVIPSKRPGYFELSGALHGRFDAGTRFSLTDAGQAAPVMISIRTTKRRICIFECDVDPALLKSDTSEDIEIMYARPVFQSSLTNRIASDLREFQRCALTPYQVSSHIHMAMLGAFAPIFSELGLGQEGLCPIT